jgi:hypothetical protein
MICQNTRGDVRDRFAVIDHFAIFRTGRNNLADRVRKWKPAISRIIPGPNDSVSSALCFGTSAGFFRFVGQAMTGTPISEFRRFFIIDWRFAGVYDSEGSAYRANV